LTEPRKLRVFLCHASQDKPVVRELHQRLKAEGWIDTWLDEENLLPGEEWETVIEKAVEDSDAVLVCLSNQSITKRGFVQRELRFVLDIALEIPEETIFIVPLRLEQCEPPRSMRTWQYADYFDAKKQRTYDILLQSLKQRHEQKLRLEAEEQTRLADETRIQKEVEEKLRREREDAIRRETEIRVRKQLEEEERQKRQAEFEKPRPRIVPPPVRVPPAPIPNGFTLSNGMEFRLVPAGKFLMGSTTENKLAFGDERPQHLVDIPYDFWMARFPVTNELYNAYVKAKGIKHPVSDWEKKKNHPVNYVNWQNAMQYCQWLNEEIRNSEFRNLNLVLRLPTEAEWEKAARWSPSPVIGRGQGEGEAREWPWGNEFDKNKCNSSEGKKGGTTPVGSYSPQGDSPYGCADMVGNVWEWTHSLYKPYPYKVNDGREDEKASGSRALRGGSFDGNGRNARCACRVDVLYNLYINDGFRLAASSVLS
jgi:formylglycine-generating enzyme required for sulfatase activity